MTSIIHDATVFSIKASEVLTPTHSYGIFGGIMAAYTRPAYNKQQAPTQQTTTQAPQTDDKKRGKGNYDGSLFKQDGPEGESIRITGLFKKTAKSGTVYYSGKGPNGEFYSVFIN